MGDDVDRARVLQTMMLEDGILDMNIVDIYAWEPPEFPLP